MSYKDEWWHDEAACQGMDTELFFLKGPVRPEVRAACARCTVRRNCLSAGLKHDVEHGIWGGKSRSARLDLAPAGRRPRSDLHRELIGIGVRLANERKRDNAATDND